MKNRTRKALLSVVLAVVCVFVSANTLTVNAADNTPESAAVVNTKEGRLNVRTSGSLNASIITSIPKNSIVTVYSVSNGWAKIEYSDSKIGYCSTDYLKTYSNSTPKRVKITSGYLNVRSGEGTGYSVKGKLYNGEYVVVIESSGKWSKIVYDGNKTGFVSSSYLVSPNNASNYAVSSKNSAKLDVVSYKQTDSRWKNVTLGSSGKTLGSIGCTTTCLAMTESFRTAATVTPKTMASRLSYNSTGSLYWPSNYVTSTSSSGLYARLKNLIDEGKPVIVGYKKYSGTMHWVVVTGYTSGGTSAAHFYINDPGSNTRTLLSQLIAEYPVFYKIAYYR